MSELKPCPWDCKIAQLEAELARRDEQIAELTARMLELTAFLRKIMLLGLLRGSQQLRDEALRILDGFEPSPSDVSTTQDVTTPEPPEGA